MKHIKYTSDLIWKPNNEKQNKFLNFISKILNIKKHNYIEYKINENGELEKVYSCRIKV